MSLAWCPMATSVRERILEATYVCVARYGMGKTTVEDAARQARMSRATLYRYFPGGKDQLLAETVGWEATRFFQRLAAAVAATPDFATMLEEALIFAHRAIEQHEVLQKVLQTEPERLLPLLTVESDRILAFIQSFLEPLVARERLAEGLTAPRAAQHLARMLLSYTAAQGRWDLADRAQVAQIVRQELLAGILRQP